MFLAPDPLHAQLSLRGRWGHLVLGQRPPTKALTLQGGGGKWGRERPPVPAGIEVGGGEARAERERGLSASYMDQENAGGLSMYTVSQAHPIKMCEMVSDFPEKEVRVCLLLPG